DAIVLQPSGTISVTASFERVQAIHNSSNGFLVIGAAMKPPGTLLAIAVDSLASGNGGAGFESISTMGNGNTTFTLANSKAVNNQIGVTASRARIFLNGSTIAGNSDSGFVITDFGAIFSYGNNAIIDTNNSGSLLSQSMQ